MKSKIELYVSIVYIIYVLGAGFSIVATGFGVTSLLILTVGGMLTTVFAFLIMHVLGGSTK